MEVKTIHEFPRRYESVVTAAAEISFRRLEKVAISYYRGRGVAKSKDAVRFAAQAAACCSGVSGDRAVAVKGDPNCSVNEGLCCVKGYHSVQILYGKDGVNEALVAKTASWWSPIQEALSKRARRHSKTTARMPCTYGQWSIARWTDIRPPTIQKGCIGTNNVEANARVCMASCAVTRDFDQLRLDEPIRSMTTCKLCQCLHHLEQRYRQYFEKYSSNRERTCQDHRFCHPHDAYQPGGGQIHPFQAPDGDIRLWPMPVL